MTQRNESIGSSSGTLLRDLCYHVCAPLPEDDIKRIFRSAIYEFTKEDSFAKNTSLEESEFTLGLKIENQLKKLNKSKDIARFQHYHRKLGSNEYSSLLANRHGVMSFLLRLSEGSNERRSREPLFPFSSSSSQTSARHNTSGSSLLKGGGDFSRDNTQPPSPSGTEQSRPTTLSNNMFIKRDVIARSPVSSKAPSFACVQTRSGQTSFRSVSHTDSLSLYSAAPQFSKCSYSSTGVSESDIIKELVYCFQGIEGSIIKLDHNLGFVLDPQKRVPQRGMVERLMEMGFLHNSVVQQCKALEKGGSVAQAIHTAIRKLLVGYYCLIGSFHWEFSEQGGGQDTPLAEDGYSSDLRLTLRRLYLLTKEPMRMLQAVSEGVRAVQGKRGGAATTALDTLRHHGDVKYQAIISDIIRHAGKPIINMIINWMVEGELFDPADEFFISTNTNCHDRDIWRDKFVLRQDFIPNVMSEIQAQMILRSGKAIHFLNVICEKQTSITGFREKLHRMKDANILDLSDPRSQLSETIAAIFEETSKLVLDTLVNKFKLFQHFQGLRRYILLGQGDFANYFMELVEPEMRKPAVSLQYHKLMGLMDTAVRATSAAFEDPHVLQRVSVKLLVASGGDSGSDVFGLQYLMHEPLDAALRLSEGAYSHMFNFLWRTKRMECILLSLRKERWAVKNKLNWLADRLPEVNGVLVIADKLSYELFHFARQFHYYILFEVVECLWEKFSDSFSKAASFDDVIRAHDIFISEMQVKTFQDERSRTFINELRLIWDLVFELEGVEKEFFSEVEKEVSLRQDQEREEEERGTSEETEAQTAITRRIFKSKLATIRANYSILNRNYQDVLKKFLLELSSKKNHELRLLSSRIDYNEYYKKIDSRLTEFMKYSRCGDLFN